MNVSVDPDVLIIGAGPGGYPAAIRAAQLGMSVVLVDKGTIGGECLNWGCIPSKALISASSFYYKLQKQAQTWGIEVDLDSVRVNMEQLQVWKQSVIDRLVSGIKQLLKLNKVEVVLGEASFQSENEVKVQTSEGETLVLKPKNVIIATGAQPIQLPGFEFDEEQILSAKGMLSLREVPSRLVIIGGGIIGLELGTVYAKLGSQVTVVELLPQILPGIDKQVVRMVQKRLKELGFTIYTESRATQVEKTANGLKLHVEVKDKGTMVIEADKVLVSVGKRASTSNLGLEHAGVEVDKRGFIVVDEFQRTSNEHVFAVGDCTGAPFLAHRATAQGVVAAEVIGGLSPEPVKLIPSAIFTDPEIGLVGLSEKQAKEQGYNVVSGKAAFAISGRALAELDEQGYAKVITDVETNKILGIEIVGPHASDLISEGALAMRVGLSSEELGGLVHPHPTLPEVLMEAAEASNGKAIHAPNRRRK